MEVIQRLNGSNLKPKISPSYCLLAKHGKSGSTIWLFSAEVNSDLDSVRLESHRPKGRLCCMQIPAKLYYPLERFDGSDNVGEYSHMLELIQPSNGEGSARNLPTQVISIIGI